MPNIYLTESLSGRAELCYDLDNLTVLCRKHHQKKDKLDLRFNCKTQNSFVY